MKKEEPNKLNTEQEQSTSPAPSRLSIKVLKVITLTLLSIIVVFTVGLFGVEKTTSSQFCSSCHEMTPQYYTWKASSHSEVECTDCHTRPNPTGYAATKTSGLIKKINKDKETYIARNDMSKEIPDTICEKCHNLTQRQVTPSGDLIIPHEKHKEEKVQCILCHGGTAHGNITERKMANPADSSKWNMSIGHEAMSDQKFIKPEMAVCIECHQKKNGPLECKACHKTGMYPENHQNIEFKEGQHGKQARLELTKCNECHSLMSREKVMGYESKNPTLSPFINEETISVKKNHYDYARENTFCRDCHSERPIGHSQLWMLEHDGNAVEDSKSCFTCHDLQSSGNITNIISCIPCHNSNDQRWLQLITPRY
jgi:nitrate/TMAO reductase-like tetraheme cytochrome c subunit